jgi:hypothetical protein
VPDGGHCSKRDEVQLDADLDEHSPAEVVGRVEEPNQAAARA